MIMLLPYDTAWATAFADEAARLRGAVPESFVDLQHVGSTAIPGLIAKPVIDILAVVSSVEALDLRRDTFEALGYEVMGEFGIPGRRYFRKDDLSGRRTHQVHAFAEGSSEIARHLDSRVPPVGDAREVPGRSRMTIVEPDEPTAGWAGRSLWLDSLAGHLDSFGRQTISHPARRRPKTCPQSPGRCT